jgi:hypothetical protein
VTKRRSVGDRWYTVLTKDPARYWWAPAPVSGLLSAAIVYAFGRDVAVAVGFGAFLFVSQFFIGLVRWNLDGTRPRNEPIKQTYEE